MKHSLEGFDRVDRITARAKTVESFLKKSMTTVDGLVKYNDPINEIHDQIGVRIIVFYLADVSSIHDFIKNLFRNVEETIKTPESDDSFGYFGMHYLCFVPEELIEPGSVDELETPFFELQIKTLYQHAWSESNHDLGYKSHEDLSSEFKRKIAFTSAQSWGADMIFNELHEMVSNSDEQNAEGQQNDVGDSKMTSGLDS